MQNALIVGPITVPMADTGPAPLGRPDQSFSVSFAEDQPVVQACQPQNGTDAISSRSAWQKECLQQIPASDLGTTGEDNPPEAAGAEALDGQPHGWVAPLQAPLPVSALTGASEDRAFVTDAASEAVTGPEAGPYPIADVLRGSPVHAESLPDSPASAWESRVAVPEPAAIFPAAPIRPIPTTDPSPQVPPDEPRLTPPSAASGPAGESGTATDVPSIATGGSAEGQDTGTRLSAPKPASTEPFGHADLGTGYRPETAPRTLPTKGGTTEMAAIGVGKHSAAHGAVGTLSDVAESLSAVGASAAGNSQAGAGPNVLSIGSGPAQVLPDGHAFGPEELGAFGNQTTGSIWERAFRDSTESLVSGMSQPVANGSVKALTSAKTDPNTVTAGAPPVLADGLAKPVQVSVVPAGEGTRWLTASTPDHGTAAIPTLPLAEGSIPHPKAGLPMDAPTDHLPDHEAGADVMLAPGIIGSSASPGNHQAIRADLVPYQVSQVAAQLAGVLRRGPSGATELALAPAELGSVRLQMEQDARDPDRLIVVITIERPETLDLFRRHAGELAEAIRNAGYSGTSIDFGQDGEDRRTDGRQDDRDSHSSPTTRDNPRDQSPMRHVIGESLDLRL